MAQITKINPVTFEAQSYSPEDEGLILNNPFKYFSSRNKFYRIVYL